MVRGVRAPQWGWSDQGTEEEILSSGIVVGSARTEEKGPSTVVGSAYNIKTEEDDSLVKVSCRV